jgi:hypothetical protein
MCVGVAMHVCGAAGGGHVSGFASLVVAERSSCPLWLAGFVIASIWPSGLGFCSTCSQIGFDFFAAFHIGLVSWSVAFLGFVVVAEGCRGFAGCTVSVGFR